MRLILHLFLALLLWSFCSVALATEPVDCSGDQYSVLVNINLSDHSFGGYLLYEKDEMVSSGWSSKPVIINVDNRKIVLVAKDDQKKLDLNFQSFKDGTGILIVNNRQYHVLCDWTAFEF